MDHLQREAAGSLAASTRFIAGSLPKGLPAPMSRSHKVLVFGDDTRSFLAIVRSLGRAGHRVHAAPYDFRAPALASRYIEAIHYLPPFLDDGAEWQAGVEALWAAEGFDLAIPCDERALLPLARHRRRFEAVGRRLAIPDDGAIDVLYDKHRTRELARKLGVHVAPGRLLGADEDAAALVAEFGLPLAIKPRASYRLDLLHARGRVSMARDVDQVAAALHRLAPGTALVEGYAQGRGCGVSVLADRGEVVLAFEHHRVHDDLTLGGSYYRRSAPLSQDLEAAARAIMGALDYTGVAMFEFRRNEATGAYVLLEVNARPWGSMPLALAAGADFPESWRRLLLETTSTPVRAYRTGLYGRNLVPDMRHVVLELQQRRHPLAALLVLGRWSLGFHRVLIGRERSDTLVPDDLRPGLAELAAFGRFVGARLARRLPGGARRWRTGERRRAEQRLKVAGEGPLVFVCQGNICRSPFAARLLAQRLEAQAKDREIVSVGMLPVQGRPSTPEAVTVAHAHGVDLQSHRSRHLDLELARRAALLIAFDERNVLAVGDRFPWAADKVIRLGALLDSAEDIEDPFGQPIDAYHHAYRRTEEGMDRLVELLP